jgi:hypothetical protein
MFTAIYEEIPLTPLGGWRNAQQYRKEYALVLEGRDGYAELEPYAPITPRVIRQGRVRRVYRVDRKPRELRVDERLPSNRRGREFRAKIRLVVRVQNALSVVEHRVEEPWMALESSLMPSIRQLTRRYGVDDLSAVELALHEHLTKDANAQAADLGLEIARASVSLDIDEDELKREQEKLEDEHYREMEMLRTQHQARLDRLRDQHRHELDALRAEQERELEALREQYRRALHGERQKLYREVLGKELLDEKALPEIVLAKLASRPSGIDPEGIDQVMRHMSMQRWEEFTEPLRLLTEHSGLIKDWQREKLIEAVLEGLAARFSSTAEPAKGESTDPESGSHPPDTQGA